MEAASYKLTVIQYIHWKMKTKSPTSDNGDAFGIVRKAKGLKVFLLMYCTYAYTLFFLIS